MGPFGVRGCFSGNFFKAKAGEMGLFVGASLLANRSTPERRNEKAPHQRGFFMSPGSYQRTVTTTLPTALRWPR